VPSEPRGGGGCESRSQLARIDEIARSIEPRAPRERDFSSTVGESSSRSPAESHDGSPIVVEEIDPRGTAREALLMRLT
jgi:hypothetical protein